jgi:hypothetical protein
MTPNIPRRIENRWTVQGILQLAGLVFFAGIIYNVATDTASAIPKLADKVETNATRITTLEAAQRYNDKRLDDILEQVREINRKIDREVQPR